VKTDEKRINPFLLLVIFSLLLVAGINAGEVSAMLEKAVKICLSCIGIGCLWRQDAGYRRSPRF
jgi:hypothetical protein